MNERELQFLSASERELTDCSALKVSYLLKSLLIKIRRRSWGRLVDTGARFVWSIDAVSDSYGPAANVRNYLDHEPLRLIMTDFIGCNKVQRACEIGCGYGRVIMVIKEFAHSVKGFE